MTVIVNERLDGSGKFPLEFWDVLSARAALPLGSAGGADRTVNEMWRAATLPLVSHICQLFRRRASARDDKVEIQ
eukprot:10564390-Karenia_brevis.AAC.1